MEKGYNMQTDMVLKYIGKEQLESIMSFLREVKKRDVIEFKSIKEINNTLASYVDSFLENTSYDDVANLKYYTGYFFKNINAIARNNWNYEDNGLLTPEKKHELTKLINELNEIISKSSVLPCDMKTFRGVNLNAFKSYGIHNMEDLNTLQNRFLYDAGFCSTSLLKESSFFVKEKSDILIEYIIPKECNDGLPLITKELSYSPIQNEYLINSSNFAYIDSVEIKDNKAYIKAILVPKNNWDLKITNDLDNKFKR